MEGVEPAEPRRAADEPVFRKIVDQTHSLRQVTADDLAHLVEIARGQRAGRLVEHVLAPARITVGRDRVSLKELKYPPVAPAEEPAMEAPAEAPAEEPAMEAPAMDAPAMDAPAMEEPAMEAAPAANG